MFIGWSSKGLVFLFIGSTYTHKKQELLLEFFFYWKYTQETRGQKGCCLLLIFSEKKTLGQLLPNLIGMLIGWFYENMNPDVTPYLMSLDVLSVKEKQQAPY
jgi:hypothetical protein